MKSKSEREMTERDVTRGETECQNTMRTQREARSAAPQRKKTLGHKDENMDNG